MCFLTTRPKIFKRLEGISNNDTNNSYNDLPTQLPPPPITMNSSFTNANYISKDYYSTPRQPTPWIIALIVTISFIFFLLLLGYCSLRRIQAVNKHRRRNDPNLIPFAVLSRTEMTTTTGQTNKIYSNENNSNQSNTNSVFSVTHVSSQVDKPKKSLGIRLKKLTPLYLLSKEKRVKTYPGNDHLINMNNVTGCNNMLVSSPPSNNNIEHEKKTYSPTSTFYNINKNTNSAGNSKILGCISKPGNTNKSGIRPSVSFAESPEVALIRDRQSILKLNRRQSKFIIEQFRESIESERDEYENDDYDDESLDEFCDDNVQTITMNDILNMINCENVFGQAGRVQNLSFVIAKPDF
ncbi:3365_t:CDS:2 [Ambispora gerdemannii]|uniref:3365_t:CDS:1 n=1 Tax=Ambispora gerdemannii TaxID=144530 RepID=A0A9N9B7Q8_9GLOM|nr:3365_t:CDS:2 [Ambispora gerdemannii]